MEFNIWVRKDTTLMVKETPDKPPIITGVIKNPQILVDTIKGTITIVQGEK